MTTPQSLTEEDLRLLESLPQWNGPNVTGALATQHTDKLAALGLAIGDCDCEPFDDDGSKEKCDPRTWRSIAGDTLLATLQSERERGDKLRESMQGTADDLDRFVGVLGEDSPLAYHVLIARQRLLNALHLDEHGSYVTVEFLDLAEATALSPDVLGDQKDKGKATDYADSKESGSVTNGVSPVPTEEADQA